jgi:hypothetical protein
MHKLDNVHAETEREIQEEQVQEVFSGPQAPSCEENNLPFSWVS